MKTLNNRLLIVLASLFFLMLTGCNTTPKDPVDEKTAQENIAPSLNNTIWHYMDNDAEYDIEFLPNSKLTLIGHPNDTDFSNESWSQKDDVVYIYFNNEFATYEGKFSGRNIISGTANNKNGQKWQWKAVRQEK